MKQAERLPGWAENRLDELLGAGVLRADDLNGLSVVQLVDLAAAYVRTCAAGQPFDATEAIASARSRTKSAREWSRKAAA